MFFKILVAVNILALKNHAYSLSVNLETILGGEYCTVILESNTTLCHQLTSIPPLVSIVAGTTDTVLSNAFSLTAHPKLLDRNLYDLFILSRIVLFPP